MGHDTEADALAAAVAFGDAKIVRSAIASGVDVNLVGRNGVPPLVLAAAKGLQELVVLLLDAGADPKLADRNGGMTALHAAAMHGLSDACAKLLERGADVNAAFGSPPITPLSLAFRRGQRPLLGMLLAAGAAPDVGIDAPDSPPEQRGTTPLLYAASTGDAEMLRLLLSHGADPNRPKDDGMTPLAAAIFRGQLESVQALVEAGADVDQVLAPGPDGAISALELAARCGRKPIASYLGKRSAN